jgi:hypothetical protein
MAMLKYGLVTLMLASIVALAQQPPPTPRGPVPPGTVQQPPPVKTYAWAPTATITAPELAQLIPLFAGIRGGLPLPGSLDRIVVPSGALWAVSGARPASSGPNACPADAAIFSLTAADTARLGALMKHLKACTP